MIEIKPDLQGVEAAFKRLADATQHRAPLMQRIAGIMQRAVADNFASEGRPAWAGLQPSSWLSRAGSLTKSGAISRARFDKKVRNAKILQKSGRLASSIVQQSDNDSAAVGTNVKYAAIQHFGGTTRPHIIRPRNKKALAWATGGHPVKSVNHPGSKIKARPYLLLTPGDEQDIVETTEDYLRAAIS